MILRSTFFHIHLIKEYRSKLLSGIYNQLVICQNEYMTLRNWLTAITFINDRKTLIRDL